MPLFVSPADVILRMQLGAELSGIDDVVSTGIIGAQLHVQRVVDGELARRSRTCVYYTDSEAFSGIQPGGMYRLEVPSGFIRQDTSVVVSYAETALGTFTTIAATSYLVEYERGYVLLDASTYGDYFIRVQCDTGFEDGTRPVPTTGIDAFDEGATYDTHDMVVYNNAVWKALMPISVTSPPSVPTDLTKWALAYVPMEQIPVELYEAIMALVPVIFDVSQVTNRTDEAEKQYRKAAGHAALLLQPFIRTKGFSFRPLWR